MKSLLYIAFNDRKNQLFGVRAKILSQCRAFAKYGYQVDLVERCGAQTVVNTAETKTIVKARKARINHYYFRSILDKQYQMMDIAEYVRERKYDACYIRYDFSDLGFIRLLKALKLRCGKIILELPTYPYDEENNKTALSRLKLLLDMHYRKQLHRYVDYICTFYAGHERIFGIPTIVTPNGFDFSTMSLVHDALPTDGLHVIAVSSMREWHGYERFLAGMRDYNQQGGKRKLIFHLVGNGRECPKYKKLADEYGLGESVVFEGALHGEALDAVYEKCAIGIDSLARHRSGIKVLSSLKSREYGAKGIPMINSCRIDILSDEFPYLLSVPADETPIDIHAVFGFYDRCFSNGRSRTEVGKEIRSYIEKRCEMKKTLAAVVKAMER